MNFPSLDDRRKAIEARLATLVKQHSQSEIARKTGAPRNKVNRYVHGARIPCDFAAALVDGLGVNPAWLLTGEGAASTRDVAPDTARVADNLLELIRAMSSVEHMQLGALTGKHHLRVLRDLSDAMRRFESLRQQLNERSTPVLRSVLADLRDSLDKHNLDRAGELCRSAEQLSRLCDDSSLALELAVLHGRLALMNGDLKGALDLARRVATLALHGSGELGPAELEALSGTVEALMRLGRVAEARRIAEAALVLASETSMNSAEARMLTAELAQLQIHTGELREGLQALAGLSGALAGHYGERVDAIFTRALLLSSALDVPAAIAFRRDSAEKAMFIIALAMLQEEPENLERALEYWRRHARANQGETYGPAERAGAVLDALKGRKKVAAQVREVIRTKPQAHEMLLDWRASFGAQIFRLLGMHADARRCFNRASRNVASLPEWFNMGVIWEARHMRNALELGTRSQAQQARAFFQRHIELGYRCFAGLV